MTIVPRAYLPPTIAPVWLADESPESEDTSCDECESDIFGSSTGKLVKYCTMETFAEVHTNKSLSSGKIEVVFLLLSLG